MKLTCSVRDASGPSLSTCHFLLSRYDERFGFKPDSGESWIYQKDATGSHALRGQGGWYTGLWRSAAGKVYVAFSVGQVLVNPDPRPRVAPWREDPVPGVLSGVWGLHDECVFVWGIRGGKNVVYRFDGSKWEELPSPPGEILAMHGIAPDLVYAVGRGDLLAHWNGKTWRKVVSPARGVLVDVFVASESEMYAVGSNKQLLQGSVHGWTEVLEGPGSLYAVAKWKGDVWVGAADHGLMKLDGAKLLPVKPNIKARRLDARDELLISSPDMIAGTKDGLTYTAVRAPFLAGAIEKVPFAWGNP
jgi:hypothetical protein